MSESKETKKGKKKRRHSDKNEEQVVRKKLKDDTSSRMSWDEESDQHLLCVIEEEISRKGRPKYIFAKHIDWKRVAEKLKKENGYSIDAAGVKVRWEELTKHVRRLRTVTELLDDVKKAVKYHIEMIPKMPLGAYQLFCMAKRPRLKEKYPDMKFSELSKRMGRKWRELEPEKKAKYEKKALEKKLDYDKRLQEWKLKNPGGFKELNGEINMKMPGKQDNVSPFSLFCNNKSNSLKEKYPDLNDEMLQSKLKKKWEKLKDQKKEKYIKEAETINAENANNAKGSRDQKDNKKEKKTQPAISAYNLFMREKRKDLIAANKDLGFGEISKMCAKLWKEIDPEKRLEYEEKAELLKSTRPKVSKEKKPINAYQIFFKETRVRLLEENSQLEFGEIASICATKWKALEKDEIERYKAKERELKEEYEAAMKEVKKDDIVDND